MATRQVISGKGGFTMPLRPGAPAYAVTVAAQLAWADLHRGQRQRRRTVANATNISTTYVQRSCDGGEQC